MAFESEPPYYEKWILAGKGDIGTEVEIRKEIHNGICILKHLPGNLK